MLNALYELGKLWIKKEELDEIEVLLDAEKLKKSTKNVILVKLNQLESNKFKFDDISIKKYSPKDNAKYLYKSGSSRGTDITPSCLITEIEKTFNNKFLKWFEQNNSNEFLNSILNCLLHNKETIFNRITDHYKDLDNKDNRNVLLTLVINNPQRSYLGDFNIFKNILIDKSSEKYYKSGSNKIKGDSVCFLCNNKKEVHGLVSSSIGFTFSTTDKKGNLPELNIKNQWKQLPICGNCALYLEAGKKFVERYLSFKEFGLSYYIIPNFLFDPKKYFNDLFEILDIESFEDETGYSKVVGDVEIDFEDIVKDLDDVLEFKFLFYERKNSAFNILAYTESILPSWMKEIYKNQRLLMSNKLFSEDCMKRVFARKTEGDLIDIINNHRSKHYLNQGKWYEDFLRTFYGGFSSKYYRKLVCSVINEEKLDFDFMLSNIMKVIRNNWRNQEEYLVKINTLKSLALILLFNNLNLYKGGKIMDSDDTKISEDIITGILNSDKTDKSCNKKATFYLGVLTRKLINIQCRELKSTPFVDKLWGLSLDKKKIQKLYPMVLNKLQEYSKKRYKSCINIQKEISCNLIKSEDKWNLTRDETSYYFVLGYTLASYYECKENKGNEE